MCKYALHPDTHSVRYFKMFSIWTMLSVSHLPRTDNFYAWKDSIGCHRIDTSICLACRKSDWTCKESGHHHQESHRTSRSSTTWTTKKIIRKPCSGRKILLDLGDIACNHKSTNSEIKIFSRRASKCCVHLTVKNVDFIDSILYKVAHTQNIQHCVWWGCTVFRCHIHDALNAFLFCAHWVCVCAGCRLFNDSICLTFHLSEDGQSECVRVRK